MWFDCSLGTKRVTGAGHRQGLNAVDIVLMTIKNIMTNLRKRLAFQKLKIHFLYFNINI